MSKITAYQKYTYAVFFVLCLCCNAICLYAQDYHDKKILYVNSYHKGYYWSDGEQGAAVEVFRKSGVAYKVVYMDTKNHPSEQFCLQAGRSVRDVIEQFKPDVLIVADDNAFEYVVMPYYRNTSLPVVFCGINWDLTHYGTPGKNVTGILEVALAESTYNHMRKYAKGSRIGFLAYDSPPERETAGYYPLYFKGATVTTVFVKDFDSWKHKFLELQDKNDMIYFGAPDGIRNWNIREAEKFVLEHVRIPLGTDASQALVPVTLVGVMKIPEEQGEYAAYTALRILGGEKPSDIAITKNKKGDLYLNLKIAEKLKVVFSPAMLRNAKEIIAKDKE